jgi:hypothetical protein
LCQTEEYQKDLAEQIKRELYTGSQRTHQWVGLTDAEFYDCDEANACRSALAYAIEAKLKEKNT